ncbi:MAG: nicotinamide-nucleotide amidohydrolase family protein [bacterium]|nr:nicotinamide-nucleotide amidohydrolase family protein [bacterium]
MIRYSTCGPPPAEHSENISAAAANLMVFRTCGLSKEQINDLVQDLLTGDRRLSFSLDSHPLGVDIQIRLSSPQVAIEPELLSRLSDEVRLRLGAYLYGEGSESMEEVVGKLLRQNHHTLATAESCTGGLIASRITDVPGSSEYFLQGVITYSNQAKKDLLGVREETLRQLGAVSGPVVQQMCIGLKRISVADLVLAVSGIAGPGGGSVEKPVGLVFIGLYDGQDFKLKEYRFQGCRKEIKLQASQMALDLVRRYYL